MRRRALIKAADLLLAEAKRRHLPVVVDEWPGGDPEILTVPVAEPLLRQVARGRKSIPLGDVSGLAAFAGLPRGSAVEVTAAGKSTWLVSGPVQRSGGDWCLPVFGDGSFLDRDAALGAGTKYRRENGYGQRSAS